MKSGKEKQQGMDRRRFLFASAGTAFSLLLGRGAASAADAPTDIVFPESTCAKDTKTARKILVAYASKCGSTGSIAEAIGESLCATGASVDVRLISNVKDLGAYQAVIVGSAIRRGQWLSEAATFLKKNQEALSRVPTAYFVACLTMKDDTPENRATVTAYLDPVRKDVPKIRPVALGLFPGVVDFSKISFMYRSVLEAKGISEGDYRNLPAVRAWAAQLGPKLGAA